MPIYEYKCSACGSIQSVLVQGFKDPDGLTCNGCGSSEMKRIISRVNYHVSGSDRLSTYNPASRHSDSFYKDTRNIGLQAEHMLNKAGVKPTDEFKSKLEKLRTDPGSVIKDSGD
ncbi:MAG TPA: zinc ribbon domain-containing protein [Deltaproteobacteria bacterium]|nr:zinc ribbon domain-containing protein [Deltaproteobacteria bacterium]HPJ94277.1 zinc ribbon domain-containing protein [Deltaproteobacteria bacterium]HPR52409.1 zinc ribbon domain-containing protein [Deltaproteobacteria bacterium]